MMSIKVRYFASVRELMGVKADSLELEQGATVAAALAAIAGDDARRDRAIKTCMSMVNQEYVQPDHVLVDGDELALIPPVSGGERDAARKRFIVTAHPLHTADIEKLVESPSAGAVALFVGTVRDHARGHGVLRLEYEAYTPAAEKMLARIGDEIAGRWSVELVAIAHRTGLLEVGEASVVIGVSSAHRAEAFDACRYAIERIKQIVPIWKKEFYDDGASWIGSEADYQKETARLSS
ncbi:molybdenum cofactor biosynthesis protein MoaE [soil metagenome]